MKIFHRKIDVEGSDMTETPENMVIEEAGYVEAPTPPAHDPLPDIEQKAPKSELEEKIDQLRQEATAALQRGDQDELKRLNNEKRALLAQL